jgi:hypothetical protein
MPEFPQSQVVAALIDDAEHQLCRVSKTPEDKSNLPSRVPRIPAQEHPPLLFSLTATVQTAGHPLSYAAIPPYDENAH